MKSRLVITIRPWYTYSKVAINHFPYTKGKDKVMWRVQTVLFIKPTRLVPKSWDRLDDEPPPISRDTDRCHHIARACASSSVESRHIAFHRWPVSIEIHLNKPKRSRNIIHMKLNIAKFYVYFIVIHCVRTPQYPSIISIEGKQKGKSKK